MHTNKEVIKHLLQDKQKTLIYHESKSFTVVERVNGGFCTEAMDGAIFMTLSVVLDTSACLRVVRNGITEDKSA
jgi:hypothetical protein